MVALKNKTIGHTFLPFFDNANGRLCQEKLLSSRTFATMVTWRHTAPLCIRYTWRKYQWFASLIDFTSYDLASFSMIFFLSMFFFKVNKCDKCDKKHAFCENGICKCKPPYIGDGITCKEPEKPKSRKWINGRMLFNIINDIQWVLTKVLEHFLLFA